MTALAIFGLATITSAQVPSYVPTSGLVGWWPFNGNANDESGNGNHGTNNGATLTADRFGTENKAYSFNSNEIYIPYNSSFNSLNITVGAWINPNNYGTSGQGAAIVHRYQYGYSKPSGEVFRLMLSQDNLGYIKPEILEVTQNTLSNAPSIIPQNLWSFVLFSFDGNSLKTYVNGILLATTNNPGFQLNISGNSGLSIGISNQANGLWYPFSGKIDDIGFWSRALTQQEITDLYNSNSVGIIVNSQSNLFSVFPNPAQSVINVKADSKLIGEIYSIYDNAGKVVLSGKLNAESTTVELGNLSGGIYMFSVGENMKQTFKVIKE